MNHHTVTVRTIHQFHQQQCLLKNIRKSFFVNFESQAQRQTFSKLLCLRLQHGFKTFHTHVTLESKSSGDSDKDQQRQSGIAYRFFKNTVSSSSPEKGSGEQTVDTACSDNDQWSNLVGRDFLSLKDFKKDNLYQLLWTAQDLKFRFKENKERPELLKGVNAVGLFHPGSIESQLCFRLGISKLGGDLTVLTPTDIEGVTRSRTKDTAKLLSGMSDMLVLGGFPHQQAESLADESNIPVISAFSDQQHPLQTLAQFLTLLEHFRYLRGVEVSWVGPSNKGMNSLLYGCARLGIDFRAANPPGYEADADIMIDAMNIAGKTGATFHLGNDPLVAVYRADAILSGPWGDADGPGHPQDFDNFQINRKMLKEADADWVYMHSLPRREEEVTDDIFYGHESAVHTEMENRMWVAMAIVLRLHQAYVPISPMPKFVRC